ncbi:hypothetical protein [Microvirga zambiensis]|jgi:hypothetical protein|uniref:hypothetical protein n=1 Tax=Microvirga zambiensis TaxID=1402137 RepID=UPI00191E64D9|nr:hypothetical protein [Microvirga zambiensis]
MTKSHRVRLRAVLPLLLLGGITAAEACDPRVTTRPGDLWGRPDYVVRDHRRPVESYPGGVVVTTTSRGPIVRDHRSPPIIRDHRR